jgi:prephenate dehydrogenase
LKVAVIGGAGRMGKWLIKYFLSGGHEVILSDIRIDEARTVAKSTGAKLAENNIEAVKDADLSVISTPIDVTPKVLEEIAPEVRRSSTVMEISSLKSKVIPILEKIAERKVNALSIHPLFGPGVQKITKERIVLIPVLDPVSELKLVTRLFPDVEVVVADPEEHDRAMALTLSLTHFMNITFASVISEEDINVLKKLGGTTFTLQLTISEGVMAEDPSLYASIQMGNEYTVHYLNKFISRAETLKRHIDEEDLEGFTNFYMNVRSLLSKDRDFKDAYERMYRALEAI